MCASLVPHCVIFRCTVSLVLCDVLSHSQYLQYCMWTSLPVWNLWLYYHTVCFTVTATHCPLHCLLSISLVTVLYSVHYMSILQLAYVPHSYAYCYSTTLSDLLMCSNITTLWLIHFTVTVTSHVWFTVAVPHCMICYYSYITVPTVWGLLSE